MTSLRRKVSVIIPHFNEGEKISRQIKALKKQSHQAKEIIIIDDGSNKEKYLELKNFLHNEKNIKIIRKIKNRGPAASCNHGLKIASGEFVCFLACDDEIKKNFIKTNVRLLSKFSQAAFCFSDPCIVDPKKQIKQTFSLYLSDKEIYLTPKQIKTALNKTSFTFSTNTILFRRKFIKEGMLDTLGSFADNYLDFKLAFTHGAVYFPGVLSHYFINDKSYSASQAKDNQVKKDQTFAMLKKLSKEKMEIKNSFKYSKILPYYEFKVLIWLLLSSEGREYLSWGILKRCLALSLWSLLRKKISNNLRRKIRNKLAHKF